jgi:hypothetical protein
VETQKTPEILEGDGDKETIYTYVYIIYRPVPVNPVKKEENLAVSTAQFQLNSFKTVQYKTQT